MAQIDNEKVTALVNRIKELISSEDFIQDLDKVLAGNKSAAARTRKKTVELGKVFKEYRAESIAAGLV